MHETAINNGKYFFKKYLKPHQSLKILDIGALDINGSLKSLVKSNWTYIGCDMCAGKNVDIVISDPFHYPFNNDEFDCIVSTSSFEHDEHFWITFLEMSRMIKPQGYIYINTPSSGRYHGYPGDCWRFYKDAYPALAKWAAKNNHMINLIEQYIDETGNWKDNVGIFQKIDKLREVNIMYDAHCRTKSDINEHLPILKKYGEKCSHITEFGIRNVVSTWAFLAAKPKRLISYDIHKSSNVDKLLIITKRNGLNFIFIQQNVLDIQIEETDLLFIDTWHTYLQLKKELDIHHSKVRKYIIMHDTETFGLKDELKNDKPILTSQLHGLIPAIDEFLYIHKEWHRKEIFENNNGLTILKRNLLRNKAMEHNLDISIPTVLEIMQKRIMNKSTYFGIKTYKQPIDFWIYQEIFFKVKPDVVIEFGSGHGGSALAIAHLLENMNHGRIYSFDKKLCVHPNAKYYRITFKLDTDVNNILDYLENVIKPNEIVIIIDDASHTQLDVLNRLRMYHKFVKKDSYYIVEDSICRHGLSVGPNPGPYEAIQEFLKENSRFIIDNSCEEYFITWNPCGYLKCIADN